MTATAPAVNPREIVTILKRHWKLWAIPAVALTALALGLGLTRQPVWKATQSLLVRDEVGGGAHRQGRFESVEAMKTAQDTIVEVSKNRQVVSAALTVLAGREDSPAAAESPSASAIDDLQQAISVSAPKGAEFGKTEVIYLAVTASARDKALARNEAVCDCLLAHLQSLRREKAHSIIDELTKNASLAQADLDAATGQLEAMETQVGSDLGELRILNDSGSGDSNLRGSLNQIKNELRAVRTLHDANEQQRELLAAAQSDTGKLVATPNRLLESQPALRRLKDGLVDAQLRTAQLMGKMSKDHPEVRGALANEEVVRQHLHDELEISLRGLTADLGVSAAQIASLEKQLAEVEGRLSALAAMRARYGNLAAEVKNRSASLEKAQQELTEAKAVQAAADSASLISKLDKPVVGNRPEGPGLEAIVGAGLFGGLTIGFGLVFLLVPLGGGQRRRISDYFGVGRRATDSQKQLVGRRTGEQTPVVGRRAQDPAASVAAPVPPPAPSRPVAAVEPPAPSSPSRDDRRNGDRRGNGRSPAMPAPFPPDALDQLVINATQK